MIDPVVRVQHILDYVEGEWMDAFYESVQLKHQSPEWSQCISRMDILEDVAQKIRKMFEGEIFSVKHIES